MLALLATITLEIPWWINPARVLAEDPPHVTAINHGDLDVCSITYETRFVGAFLSSDFEEKTSLTRVPANGSAVISREFKNRVRLVDFQYCDD